MKKLVIFLVMLACFFSRCTDLIPDDVEPAPDNWGPHAFQIDVEYKNGTTGWHVNIQGDSQLVFSPDLIPSDVLPFHFYDAYFDSFREIIVSSPYPIRPNWFQVYAPGCLDPGNTASGIEFAVTTAREKDYLLIARLDSSYWACLKQSANPVYFSFQVLENYPALPVPFALRGFYNQQQELLHLKAKQDLSGIWHPTHDYQVFQEPGPKDFTIRVSQHPQLGLGQSLVRISSRMRLVPQSVWIGLAGECLDQADWEVHRNRLNDRFLLDIVIPDCYLDCLNNVADGFEFEVQFFQFIP